MKSNKINAIKKKWYTPELKLENFQATEYVSSCDQNSSYITCGYHSLSYSNTYTIFSFDEDINYNWTENKLDAWLKTNIKPHSEYKDCYHNNHLVTNCTLTLGIAIEKTLYEGFKNGTNSAADLKGHIYQIGYIPADCIEPDCDCSLTVWNRTASVLQTATRS